MCIGNVAEWSRALDIMLTRLVLQCIISVRSNGWRVNKDLSKDCWIKFADVFKKALHFIMNTNFLTGKENFIIM
jgi:hypothetical protein